MFTTLSSPSMNTMKTLVDPRNWRLVGRVMKRLKAVTTYVNRPPSTTTGWAGKSYFSAGPFALGDGAMKFSLRPRQTHALDVATTAHEPTSAQRVGMDAWIAAGKDAVFDLCVQLATPDCIPSPGRGDPPKAVMTAEYCDLEWDESKSPYVAVGTLTFPATAQRDLARQFSWSPLQFNAWNTAPAMRPLGQIFRARKLVHKAHCEVRLDHVYGAELGTMVDKAPYDEAT